MEKHLVLVGGGHAHMVTLANLHHFVERGFRVTVVGPSEYHYYLGMGPGMLGGTYAPAEIRFATRQVVEKQGGVFILDKGVRVDPENRIMHLESGKTLPYDVISFNAGSFVPRDILAPESGEVFTVKPIEKLMEAQRRILELSAAAAFRVAVVGGGASAVEIAGNVWRLVKRRGTHPVEIAVFAGRGLMSRFPPGIARMARRSFKRRNIRIFEKQYVQEVRSGRVVLQSGEPYSCDLVFLAAGVRPSSIFRDSGLPTGPDGGLLVNRFLQSPSYPEIFGGGDCIYFQPHPLDKVGVYAVRENPILYHNLLASLEGTPLEPFDPGGDYLLIFNLGDGTGIFRKKMLLFGGHAAFMIKDYIDRRFIRTFQAIEQEGTP